MPKPNEFPTHPPDYSDTEDEAIDFSNAVLYVGALQTILATAAASLVSILSCWLLPVQAISAVRTLVLASIVAALLVRKPFRLGRVHGLGLIFNALRPCVAIYIASMVLEQLVHTCTRDSAAPSWRRLVFHFSTLVAMLSGFARARKPLEQTDAPFLATGASLLVIAMLPPPAVILSGPLCAEPTFNASAERLIRSLVFSVLYCTFVYASAPPVHSSGEVVVCVMRASAASLWVLGCHIVLLPLAVVQAGMVIYIRIYSDEYRTDEMLSLMRTSRDDDVTDSEIGGLGGGGGGSAARNSDVEMQHAAHFGHAPASPQSVDSPHRAGTAMEGGDDGIAPVGAVSTTAPQMKASLDVISPSFGSMGARGLVNISGAGPCMSSDKAAVARCSGGGGASGMSKERMAAIAAQMALHESASK